MLSNKTKLIIGGIIGLVIIITLTVVLTTLMLNKSVQPPSPTTEPPSPTTEPPTPTTEPPSPTTEPPIPTTEPTTEPSTEPVIDCIVGSWSDWSECSELCGGGIQSRNRLILQTPQNEGIPCPLLTETRICNNQTCPQLVSKIVFSAPAVDALNIGEVYLNNMSDQLIVNGVSVNTPQGSFPWNNMTDRDANKLRDNNIATFTDIVGDKIVELILNPPQQIKTMIIWPRSDAEWFRTKAVKIDIFDNNNELIKTINGLDIKSAANSVTISL
jgi:hypothetical protein